MTTPGWIFTNRDHEILSALDRMPLTARQMLSLSKTFAQPFTEERRIRERLQFLQQAGLVRQFRYAIAGTGLPAYYLLSRQGYKLLYGTEAKPIRKRAFQELSVSRQFHTYALSDFLTHFFVAAHQESMQIEKFFRENERAIVIAKETLFPDAAFDLRLPSGVSFSYFVELDNSTERVTSRTVSESWERKLRLYDALASTANRFRVLLVTTKSRQRVEHLLATAHANLSNKQRVLFLGTFLPAFLSASRPLFDSCLLDERLRSVPLVKPLRLPSATTPQKSKLPSMVSPLPC